MRERERERETAGPTDGHMDRWDETDKEVVMQTEAGPESSGLDAHNYTHTLADRRTWTPCCVCLQYELTGMGGGGGRRGVKPITDA